MNEYFLQSLLFTVFLLFKIKIKGKIDILRTRRLFLAKYFRKLTDLILD